MWGDSPSVDMGYDLPHTPYNGFHSVALVPESPGMSYSAPYSISTGAF